MNGKINPIISQSKSYKKYLNNNYITKTVCTLFLSQFWQSLTQKDHYSVFFKIITFYIG